MERRMGCKTLSMPTWETSTWGNTDMGTICLYFWVGTELPNLVISGLHVSVYRVRALLWGSSISFDKHFVVCFICFVLLLFLCVFLSCIHCLRWEWLCLSN